MPALALAVAVPAHAASGDVLDASNVEVTFANNGSSEFLLSGFVALSAPSATPVAVTATFTFVGTGPNTGAEGLYLYADDGSGFPGSIPGWVITQGAADDLLHPVLAFQTTLTAGETQAPTISSYGGSTSNPAMFGADTWTGTEVVYDGVLTIRFSAPGYDDAEVVRAFMPPV